MIKKSSGEHAVAIHKAIAELNELMMDAGHSGIRVDLDQRELKTMGGGCIPVLTVALYERITP